MEWFEHFIIMSFLGIIHQVVKNPAKAAALQHILLGAADDIYSSYGVTPPTHP